MALAPLSAAAYSQDYGVPPAYMPGASTPAGAYAPAGMYPPMGGPPGGYANVGGGYVTPAGMPGPMVAPPPMVPSGGPTGLAIPSGSVFTPRLVTSGGYGDGLGWDDGYQSVGAWIPLGLNNDSQVLYLDARGFSSFEEGGGGNFNLGYRYYVPGMDRFFGAYVGYDIDAGNAESNGYHQFVVGGESVGRYLTYRVNGYVPTDYDGDTIFTGQAGEAFFRGNNILFLDRTVTRYQYGGVDGEVGGPLPLLGKYGLSGYLGGYFVASDVDEAVGFQGRLESNINDDLQVGGKLTTDEIFDTNVWVTMTLRSPKGSWADFFRRDWLRQPKVKTQMDRSPERNYRVMTDVKIAEAEELAINPQTGIPYLVLHVDPNGGGNGTFENPAGGINGFNDPSFDIVYVRPGTLVTPGPIRLFDDQRLLSTAVTHVIDTQRGVIQLPGFTGGSLPLLQNGSANPSAVVLLASDNEVSGFRIDGTGPTGVPTHVGVLGQAAFGDSFVNINRNLFTNNSGAGFALVLSGTAQAGLSFTDNLVTGTVDDTNGQTPFFGSGVYLSTVDSATISGVVIDDNLFEGNEGDGVTLETRDLATIADVVIGDEDGDNDSGNVFTDNRDGVNLLRGGAARVDDLRIVDNDIIANNRDGISLTAAGSQSFDLVDAVIAQNTIAGNFDDGIQLQVRADAILSTEIYDNDIVQNGGSGIETSEIVASPGDLRSITGFWDNNLIVGNGENGIDSNGSTGDLFVGRRADGTSDGNVIAENGFAGVLINSSGTATYLNNVITENGALLGNDFTLADGDAISIVGAGIDIQSVGFKGLTFVNNDIFNNVGDGVEINNDFQFFELVFTDNVVNNNRGRGYDVLNQDDGFTDLTIQGTALGASQINQNDFEGVYIVNTASPTQGQTGAAEQPSGDFAAAGGNPSHGLARDGSVDDSPILVLTFLQNTVVGNGTGRDIPEVFDASGLAIRVGTSSGGYFLTGGGPGAQVGGFVSDGNQTAGTPLSQSASLTGFGGVLASVNGNFFAGNQGEDFFTESFTSTVDPVATGGTWSDTVFDPDNPDNGDPLARLDLEFLNNTFDEIDPINLGAFYNNAEDTFKSRTNGRTPPDPQGPFPSGARRRNAQRLAFRDGLPPFTGPNQPGDFNEYKYQGMGDSTFRVTNETVVQNPIFLFQTFLPGSQFGETSYTFSIIP